MMKVGSLFSGGGLGDFGFLATGMEIAWQCEIDDYCQKILALRYPESKKYKDIKQLKGDELEPVDLVAGGFPCQPFSIAGNQRGREDDRYLWPEMCRVISEVRPPWIVGENVPGIISLSLDDVLNDLETLGYETASFVFPAHALGAPHRRDRLWIVGHAQHFRRSGVQESGSFGTRNGASSGKEGSEQLAGSGCGQGGDENLGDTESERRRLPDEQGKEDIEPERSSKNFSDSEVSRSKSKRIALRDKSPFSILSGSCSNVAHAFSDTKGTAQRTEDDRRRTNHQSQNWNRLGSNLRDGNETFRRLWESEPAVGRVAHGVADRVHRLKMLGNGQVPACTYVIGKMIMEIEDCSERNSEK